MTALKKVGHRINEWFPAVGVSRSKTYQLLNDGVIESVKIGRARVITTTPADYLASLVDQMPPAPFSGALRTNPAPSEAFALPLAAEPSHYGSGEGDGAEFEG